MDTTDVILAIGSPPGRSLRGIIRVSGADALTLLLPHLRLAADMPLMRGAHRARLSMERGRELATIAMVFPGPQSYTGENLLELQVPGNPLLLERIVDMMLSSARSRSLPARRAEPGEFTARAFFNGKLTLTQAEGVAATIAAQSDAELRAAHLLTTGTLGAFAHRLMNQLASALALVEAGIDFTDQEDVVAIAPEALHDRLLHLRAEIESHLRRSVGIEQLQAIPWVVLVGEPNAGKSSLFNALLGHERAVVSNIAGTTRDVLAEPLAIGTSRGSAEVMLVDLAGLDDGASPVNRLMQLAAQHAIDRAELILRCVPVDEPAPIPIGDRELLVRTKADLAAAAASTARGLTHDRILVSARSGDGLHGLRHAIAQRLATRAVSLAADAMALSARHESALRSAHLNLTEAIALIQPHRAGRSLPNAELVASAMRAALDDLGALAGEMTPDDILGRIFATFCVGK